MSHKRIRVMRIIARMSVGGPALQITGLMRGLSPEYFDHRLYAGVAGPGEIDYLDLRASDIAVRRVPTLGRSLQPGDDVQTLLWLRRAVREFRPHIVHTHTAKAGALGRVAAAMCRVPVRIHTFHGHLLHGYFSRPKTRLVVGAERVLARLSDHLIAVGGQVRDDLIAAGIGRREKYFVVPPGAGLHALPDRASARHRLGLPADGPVVAYVGRVTKIKRPDRLLDVVRAVRREIPQVRFIICGGGDLQDELDGRAGDLHGALHLLGWRADVETVYAAADVALLTSDNEGMPVSLIEAGLAGLPAVATRVGSVSEVVRDKVTGLLCAPNAEELSHSTVRLLREEALRLRLGAHALAWTTEQFATTRLVADIHRLYASIAVDRGWWPPSMLNDSMLKKENLR
jgi:glycosyltransferase involved in cell wall biosynthesis